MKILRKTYVWLRRAFWFSCVYLAAMSLYWSSFHDWRQQALQEARKELQTLERHINEARAVERAFEQFLVEVDKIPVEFRKLEKFLPLRIDVQQEIDELTLLAAQDALELQRPRAETVEVNDIYERTSLTFVVFDPTLEQLSSLARSVQDRERVASLSSVYVDFAGDLPEVRITVDVAAYAGPPEQQATLARPSPGSGPTTRRTPAPARRGWGSRQGGCPCGPAA